MGCPSRWRTWAEGVKIQRLIIYKSSSSPHILLNAILLPYRNFPDKFRSLAPAQSSSSNKVNAQMYNDISTTFVVIVRLDLF